MGPIFQAHPIPQNVTNFEFHLVGDMTLKQFAYLAGGLGFAFLIFTTLVTVQPIIAWPIIIISSLLGVAFAFLPIQERPLDHWVAAFFKAIFKPTSLKFSSKIIDTSDPLFGRRLNHYVRTYEYAQAKAHAVLGNPNLFQSAVAPSSQKSSSQPQSPLSPPKKQNFIDKFKAGQTSFAPLEVIQSTPVKPLQTIPPVTLPSTLNATPSVSRLPDLDSPAKPAPLPQVISKEDVAATLSGSQDLKKTVELAKTAQDIQQQIVKIEESLSHIKQQAAKPGVDPKTYIEDFQDLVTSLQKLNQEASENAKELAQVSNTSVKPTPIQPPITIKAISIPTLKLTSFPNVINGIVTDSLGSYIEGAIVVAHDTQGLPVRALKSNKLGQFVAATPLPNGEYTISVEKDNLIFDKVSTELRNEILPPILVAAKKIQQQVNQIASQPVS